MCHQSYNPLGDLKTTCPPSGDFRNPPVIDMYNNITRSLCSQFNISFIDTNDIIGIMWDRAPDWCHYTDVSGKIEAEYILAKIYE